MHSVRICVEATHRDPTLLAHGSCDGRTPCATLEEKGAIRRTMSCYWASSLFSLDLTAAVRRHGAFIAKMHVLDWLHLTSTTRSLLTKYERYFAILPRFPDQIAVLTLDIDLAWHTHQLSRPNYDNYSLATTGVFIDHDDQIAEGTLSTAYD